MKYFTWFDWFQFIGGFIVLFIIYWPLAIVMILFGLWMWYKGRGCFDERINEYYEQHCRERNWPYN